jgi:hypothetical protein
MNEYHEFICDYSFDGQMWSVHIHAKSFAEAEERLKKIAHGKIVGMSKVEIPYELGWLAKGFVWLKQTFGGLP